MNKFKKLLSMLLVCCLLVCVLPISALAVVDSGNNDSSQNAQYVSLGDTISGAISEKGDVDYYKFTLTESGRVSLDFTSYMEYYSVYIYDTAGSVMWQDESNEYNSTVGFRQDVYHIDLSNGTYYLKVIGYNGYHDYDATGNYTIVTSFTSANATETELNDSALTANKITLGSTVRGQIAVNNDIDFYQFTLTESGRVSLDFTSYMEYYSVYIYDTAGLEMWKDESNDYDSTTGFRQDQYDMELSAGTYNLKVIGYNGYHDYDATGNYTIVTSFTSANATETESNDSALTANKITFGSTVRGQIAVNKDIDFYQFTLTESGRVSLDFTSYMEYYSVYIYDTAGSEMWKDESNDYDSTTGFRQDQYNIELSAGTYYLKVIGYNGYHDYDATGNYTFCLNFGDRPMRTGWLKIGSKWYYLNSSGTMHTGWLFDGGKWYYLNSWGVMQTGWQKVSGKWYFLNSSGVMQTGWLQLGGKWYYLNSSGAMQTGWLRLGGKWYYLNGSGVMQTGWLRLGGKWYYLNGSGVMQTGWLRLGGKWYYLNGSGVMQTGWLQLGGKWYYLNTSGVMVTGYQTINGKTYRFNSSGVWIP